MTIVRTARWALWLSLCSLAGCAAAVSQPVPTPVSPAEVPAQLQSLPVARLLLLGEQHDADAHQALARTTVQHLAARGALAALVLEMADRGNHTNGLPRDAADSEVRQRLRWNDEGWPWSRYGPTVMAAVAAGVPVLGGNQPRADMRAAMGDTALDGTLPPAALERQRDNIDRGHCGLLPSSQLAPMARIQIARDRAMADTLVQALAAAPGSQVAVLVAGNEHVRRVLGVPAHLPPAWQAQAQVVVMHSGEPGAGTAEGADRVWLTPATPPKDHCAELRQRFQR